MALSLDDKLLGEKTHYYCSSSEDEADDNDQSGDDEKPADSRQAVFIPEPELKEYGGTSTNTGPKGVLNDWREFKKLESEKREEAERERQALLKKLSLTCRSHLDDEKEKEKDQLFLEQIEKDLEEFEDEFMKEYRQRRIEEMRNALIAVPKFGKLYSLSPGDFSDSIDKEKASVTIIVHLYEDVPACESMNTCLMCLAEEYPTVKFCKMKASEAKLSLKFALSGVPALLVYKNKELIGNFIRLSDEFGTDIYASDVESFLDEHGFLPNKEFVNSAIRDKTTGELRGALPQDNESDSDYDVD
ncbi:phosducin-like protein [Liolophura sinensis]|uniref:phosducin-like protein n=1 Tax=Liolophura sinensis TaxID=3198878 RepID=UPI00315922FF